MSKLKRSLCVVCLVVVSIYMVGCSLMAPPEGFPTEPIVFTGDLATGNNGDYLVALSVDEAGNYPPVDGSVAKWWFFDKDVSSKDAPNPPKVTWELNGIVEGEYYIGVRLRSGDFPDPTEHYKRLIDDTYSVFVNGNEIDIYSAGEAFEWEIADWGGGTILAIAQSEEKVSLKNGDKISVVSYKAAGMVYNLILYPEEVTRVWFAD